MKINTLLATISAIVISAGASQAPAQEVQPGIFKVEKAKSQTIDRHQACRVVANDGNNPIMVPVGTAQQWRNGTGAFLNNISGMPGVSVKECGYVGFGGTLYAQCAVAQAGGGVYCAGEIDGSSYNKMRKMNSFPDSETFVEVVGAYFPAGSLLCGVAESSKLYCTDGRKDNARLIGSGYRKIAAGASYGMAAIKNNGTVVKWESPAAILSGSGTVIPGSSDAVELAVHSYAGGFTACYVTSAGSVYCHGTSKYTGSATYYMLGIGGNVPNASGVVKTGLTGIKDIVAVTRNFCALAENGNVHCWGHVPGYPGGTGLHDSYGPVHNVPVILPGLKAKSIKSGSTLCATTMDDRIACWGVAVHGLLGSGETQNLGAAHKTTKGFVYANMPVGSEIVGGGLNGMCANYEGDTYCWGLNHRGELGIGPLGHINVPKKVLFE